MANIKNRKLATILFADMTERKEKSSGLFNEGTASPRLQLKQTYVSRPQLKEPL
jgi:hypothetical protein